MGIIPYTMHMMPSYRPGPHHILLARYLEEVEAGRIQRLMIFMPPRNGKSEMATIRFPAWYIGRNPDRRVIITSYGAHLAQRFGGAVRNQFEHYDWPFESVMLQPNSKARDQWDIAGHRGGMLAAGLSGTITGQGAELIIIDDPVKNREEADSEVVRNATHEWYTGTLYNRLEPRTDGKPGAIVLIMTRWHEDDLAGRLLQAQRAGDGDRWTVLSLPAIAEEHDALGREPGEALWPEKYPVPALERIRDVSGERSWNALYQQRPMPAEGGLIKSKWWRFWSYTGNTDADGTMENPYRLPEFEYQFQSWDLTFKDGKANDFVVGQVWGVKAGFAYLIDQVRARLDFVGTKDALIGQATKHPRAHLKLIEDTANGPAIISELRSRVPGLVPVTPEGSKYARLASVAAYIESGNVILPHPTLAPWVQDFIAECAAFPQGAHDDQADALSQALHRAARGFEEVLGGIVTHEDRVTISRW